MSEWKQAKLGDIADMCLGKMLDKEKNKGVLQPYLANLNVRWGGFELSNLSTMRFEESESERYGLRSGDLVICEGGEPGRCAIWRDEVPEMKIQKAIHRLRTNKNYSNEFVYYQFLLAGRSGELAKHFNGSTIKHLTGYSLKQVEFKFPPLAEQTRIAAVLSALDAKIALNQRINHELEGMAKLLYDYWLVQYDFPLSAAQAAALGKPRLAGQPYRTSGGTMVYHDQLKREIPAIWKVESLGKIANNVRDSIDPKDINQETPYVGLEHIERQNFSLWRWGISSDVDSQKSKFKKSDFLFGKLRPYFHKVCQTPFDGICSTDILVIRAKGEKYQNLVGCQIFESDFVEYTTKHSSGTQMPRANWSAMSDYKITIPDDQTLEAFNQLIQPLATKCNNSVLQNQELTTLRDWLLPMLMNGQVRVG